MRFFSFSWILIISCLVLLSCKTKKDLSSPLMSGPLGEVHQLFSGEYISDPFVGVDSVERVLKMEIKSIPSWNDQESIWFSMSQEDTNTKEFIKEGYFQLIENDQMIFLRRYSEMNPTKTKTNLVKSDLRKQNGCSILVRKIGEQKYQGTTIGKKCSNRFKGSLFARFDLQLRADHLIWTEQGFDEYDRHIWGPKKKGIFFKRKG